MPGEPLNTEYRRAVDHERRNRLLAYLHFAPDFQLPLRIRRSFAIPCVTLRWWHVLELQRTGNAFLTSLEPAKGDFIEILWLLHPYYRTAYGTFPNLPAGARRPLRLYVVLTRWIIRMACRQLVAGAAERIIRLRVQDAFQDRATPPEEENPSELAPTIQQLDLIGAQLSHLTRDQLLNESVARTLQIGRVNGILEGRGDDYVPPSARLIKLPPKKP